MPLTVKQGQKNGKFINEVHYSNWRLNSPAVATDGTVYISSSMIYALNPDGTKKWVFDGVYGPRSPAIGFDGTVYFGEFHGTFYAIDGKTGAKKWEFEGESPGSPAIGSDGTVYISCGGDGLYALDGETGAKKWKFDGGILRS